MLNFLPNFEDVVNREISRTARAVLQMHKQTQAYRIRFARKTTNLDTLHVRNDDLVDSRDNSELREDEF